jgi:hypothetical protein
MIPHDFHWAGNRSMPHPRLSGEEVQRLGEQLYEQRLRPQLEIPGNLGKVAVIDVETGEYEVDSDEVAAVRRALARHPGAALWALRIGFNAVHSLGGSLDRTKQ